jgi:O-antigen ligase
MPAIAPPGLPTWVTGAACTLVLTALAAGSHSIRVSLVALAAMTALIVFLVRPLLGLCVVVAVRPALDRWSNTTLFPVKAHLPVNPGTLVAILVVTVGGVYLLENWALLRRAPTIRAFAALVVLALLSIPLSNVKTVGVEETVRLLAIIVIYGLAFVCVRRPRDLAVLAVGLVCGGLLPAFVSLWQAYDGGLGIHAGFPRTQGTLATFDALGILMALVVVFTVPLAATRTRRLGVRIFACASVPFLLAALVSSYGRTGWAAATLGLLIVGATRYRWLIAAVPVLIAGVALALPSTTSRVLELSGSHQPNTFIGRVHQWTAAIPEVEHRPVLGEGFGSLSNRSSKSLLSDYVRTLVELGIPGLAVYLWMLASALVSTYRSAVATRYYADRLTAAICLGAAACVPAYFLMAGDSNLLTQIVIAGTFWAIVGGAQAMAQIDWRNRPEAT